MRVTVPRPTRGNNIRSMLGSGFPSMEQITRPFAVVESEPFNRLLPGAEIEYDPPEAIITWGASSQFIVPPISSAELPDDGDGTGIEVVLPGDGDGPMPTVNWDEISRTTSDLRVENPDDPEQYVIVRRIESMVFQASTGVRVALRFRNR